MLQIDRAMLDINERHVVQEIQTMSNLEHRYNPYKCRCSTANSYWKEKNNEQPGIH